MVEALPAWTSNRLKRLVLMPKRHILDTGLLGAVLRLDVDLLMRRGDLMGRVIESFVVAQIRAELPEDTFEMQPRTWFASTFSASMVV